MRTIVPMDRSLFTRGVSFGDGSSMHTAYSLFYSLLGCLALSILGADTPDPAAVERGRVALTGTGYLKPAWKEDTYKKVGKFWGFEAPDPDKDPEGYAQAFMKRYGLHPAPYPNDGYPMGLRKGNGPDGTKVGLQIDCMVCHGGSIGGTSYVGIGNSQLDLTSLLNDLTIAEGRKMPPALFTLNTARGTVNAGQIAAVLLSVRNSDMSRRTIPIPLGANFPELNTPAWWNLGPKATMYHDGRTDASSVRSNMQFMLGELSLKEFQNLEPTFKDIQAYLKSLTPPKYPFAIDSTKAERGKAVFTQNCAKCHGKYGVDGAIESYPSRIVEIDVIGSDRVRFDGTTDRLVKHYNSTWFGEVSPVNEEGIGYQAPPLRGVWATAPYLHNGSIPTLAALLKSSTRPNVFKLPTSTDFTHFDQVNVGWKVESIDSAIDLKKLTTFEARHIYDTNRVGLGNGGHTFGDKLSDEQRMDLMEYLKTL